MLKTRIFTAMVLLAILLPALLAKSFWPFTWLTLLFVSAAAWEWARLNGLPGTPALATGLLCAAICAALWLGGVVRQPLLWLWCGTALVWGGGGGWLLARGIQGWPCLPRMLRWVLGLLALCVAWLALAQARLLGINFLLSVLALVWTADVCAYFAGRALGGRLTGGRKLAAAISPGKSWEGVWGGMLGALLLAIAWLWLGVDERAGSVSLYGGLHQAGDWLLVTGVLLLAGISVVGDLLESLVKRSAGMKDSSRLLPGHGGVLDRIDALLPTLPLALLLNTLAQEFAA